MKTRVYVNRQRLKEKLPISIKRGSSAVVAADHVVLGGPSVVRFNPTRQPKVWVETEGDIYAFIDGKCIFKTQ